MCNQRFVPQDFTARSTAPFGEQAQGEAGQRGTHRPALYLLPQRPPGEEHGNVVRQVYEAYQKSIHRKDYSKYSFQ